MRSTVILFDRKVKTPHYTAAEEAEPMLSHYHMLLRYLGWKDCGTVVAAGMWPAGTVNDTEYSRQAYELGCKCFG